MERQAAAAPPQVITLKHGVGQAQGAVSAPLLAGTGRQESAPASGSRDDRLAHRRRGGAAILPRRPLQMDLIKLLANE